VRVEIESLAEGVDLSEPLTRARFEELVGDLLKKTLGPVRKARTCHLRCPCTACRLRLQPEAVPWFGRLAGMHGLVVDSIAFLLYTHSSPLPQQKVTILRPWASRERRRWRTRT